MSKLTPDLAEKVLQADERNIVKKAGDGGVLSPTERELVTKATFGAATADDIHRARDANLLIRFSRGLAMAPDQRARVAELLKPSPRLLQHVTRASYQHDLAHYAAQLGYGTRALERWIEAGRSCDPPDPPPFDDGAQSLVNWWGRMKDMGRLKQKVPERLARLAASAAKVPPQGGEGSPPPATNGDSVPSQTLQLPQGSGFSAALDRCRENERVASARLQNAIHSGDAGRISVAQSAWDKAFDSLRKAEKDAEGVLIATGELVRWSEVENDLAEMLQSLHQSVRSIFVRVATKVPVPAELYHLLDRAMQDELDRLFEQSAAHGYRPQSAPTFELAA